MLFLGVARELDEVGWNAPSLPLLWRYNQHYFDDLCAQAAEHRNAWHRALITRWVAENPPGRGTAWAPYPTSLRIVNWVKAWCAVPGVPPPDLTWIQSLAVQARWLTQCLEWHLLGNHLFANAKALVLAGLFFEGAEADAWLEEGTRILSRELPEQILLDGGHFERTPMYHALALEDVLDLLNALQAYGLPQTVALQGALAEHVPPMLKWLRTMMRPDGTLVRFNDCADGIAPDTCELERYAKDLGFECGSSPIDPPAGTSAVAVSHLAHSGYVRLEGYGASVWLDLAPIGPDYLPGHAHADTLSFELAVAGKPIVVNRGTSEYGEGPRRQLERGTSAHSTLEVAGHDSSEVWAGFRVGRRARVSGVRVQPTADGVKALAQHDGYSHLPGRPVHQREWMWGQGAQLHVLDEVHAQPAFRAWAATQAPTVVRFHVAPGLVLADAGGGHWEVRAGSVLMAVAHVVEGEACVETWQHAQAFGELREAATLVVKLAPGTGRSSVVWRWGSACTSFS